MGQATLNSLKSDPTALANILKYHVVSGTLMAADLMVNEKQLTSLAAQNIRVNYYRYNKVCTAINRWLALYVLFINNKFIYWRLESDNDRLYAMAQLLKLERFPPSAGLKPRAAISAGKSLIQQPGLQCTAIDLFIYLFLFFLTFHIRVLA